MVCYELQCTKYNKFLEEVEQLHFDTLSIEKAEEVANYYKELYKKNIDINIIKWENSYTEHTLIFKFSNIDDSITKFELFDNEK